jgi:hypothetical protein
MIFMTNAQINGEVIMTIKQLGKIKGGQVLILNAREKI